MTPNMRIVNTLGEDGGRWIVHPADTKRLAYIRRELAEMQRIEPSSGWRLETRGTTADWHPFTV